MSMWRAVGRFTRIAHVRNTYTPLVVPALRAGCCPEPPPSADLDGSATRRHLIRARHYKTAYDEDGNHLSEGLLRPAPWVAVPQVVAAIRILERQAAPSLRSLDGR